MQKDNLINLFLYLASLAIIFGLAYPLYNGGGYNMLQSDKSILSELAKKKELENLSVAAEELSTVAVSQGEAYSNIEMSKLERIDKSIAKSLDISRVVNDFDKMAKGNKMYLASITFNKSNNTKYSNLTVYDINITVEGDYLNFRKFLSLIENSLELYNIKSLAFSPSEEPNEPYKFNIILEAFELK